MAYDATRAAAIGVAAPAPFDEEFDGGSRLAVLVGAIASGAMVGAALALTFGRFEAIYAHTAVALICAAAAYFASRTFLESCDRGRPVAAVLIGFHVVALVAMPIVLQLAPTQATLGVYAAFATLILFAATVNISNAAIGRMTAHAALLTLAAVYQALFGLMG